MAGGDWIPVSVHLVNCPEVFALAERTRRPVDEVIGMLIRFWSWAQSHTPDGSFPGYTLDTLAKCARVPASFLRGMVCVGWLESTDNGTAIPKFDKWFGPDFKRRLAVSRRVREYRRRLRESESPDRGQDGRDKAPCWTSAPSVAPEACQCNADVTLERYTCNAHVTHTPPYNPPHRSIDDEINKTTVVVDRTNGEKGGVGGETPQDPTGPPAAPAPSAKEETLRAFAETCRLWPNGPRRRRDRELVYQACYLAKTGCEWAAKALRAMWEAKPRNPGAYLQRVLLNSAPSEAEAMRALASVPVPPEILDSPPVRPRASPPPAEEKPDPALVRDILREAMAVVRANGKQVQG